MGTSRLPFFDNIKFLLITLVVIGHAIDSTVVADHNAAKAAFVFIYSFHMPLFIFISGLFVNRKKLTSQGTIQRIALFVVLGYSLKILMQLVPALFGKAVVFKLLTESGIPWFMFAMAAFSALAYFLRDLNPRVVLGLSVVLGLFVGYDSSIGDYLFLSRIVVFFPFFWLGVILDAGAVEAVTRRPGYRVVGAAAIIVFAVVCLVWTADVYPYRSLFTGRNSFATVAKAIDGCSWLNRLIAYVISLITCAGFMAVVPHARMPFVTEGGRRSLQVYMLHGPVLQLLRHLGVLGYLAHLPGYGWCSVPLLAAVVSCALMWGPLEKPIAWLSRALKNGS